MLHGNYVSFKVRNEIYWVLLIKEQDFRKIIYIEMSLFIWVRVQCIYMNFQSKAKNMVLFIYVSRLCRIRLAMKFVLIWMEHKLFLMFQGINCWRQGRIFAAFHDMIYDAISRFRLRAKWSISNTLLMMWLYDLVQNSCHT